MKSKVENNLLYHFKNKELLQQALLIPSKAKTKQQSYERLEFLGDRVIALVIAHILFEKYPDEQQGDLSKRFVALVRKETLSEIAENIELLDDVHAMHPGIPIKDITESMQSDLLEALIAAVYLDGGYKAAEKVIERLWESLLEKDLKPPRDDRYVYWK
jgi:ribonuclease-3